MTNEKINCAASFQDIRSYLHQWGSADILRRVVECTDRRENSSNPKRTDTAHQDSTVHQAAYVWGQAMVTQPGLPSPADWGRQYTDHGKPSRWTNLMGAGQVCYDLIHCGSQKLFRGIGKKFQSDLRWTTLWEGSRNCNRRDGWSCSYKSMITFIWLVLRYQNKDVPVTQDADNYSNVGQI